MFREHPFAVLYLENCSKIKGILVEKLVDIKLVSSAYWESFNVSFFPGSLSPLMLGSLLTLFLIRHSECSKVGKRADIPVSLPFPT